jgi:hypothetical protein
MSSDVRSDLHDSFAPAKPTKPEITVIGLAKDTNERQRGIGHTANPLFAHGGAILSFTSFPAAAAGGATMDESAEWRQTNDSGKHSVASIRLISCW